MINCDEHALDLGGSVGFICRGILRPNKYCIGYPSEYPATNLCKLVAGYSEVAPLYSIVLSSMILFKRSFGLTRSLFILYVHEHDRLEALRC